MLTGIIPLLVSILGAAPQVVASIEQIWGLLSQGQTVTVEQQAQINAALAAAHKALQDA